ncbi:unnamed protein product [Hydatigera taeniaeformis]|uniref:DNA_MISMATCH_REPAIR_2 domain-containing protein n=1 Tax=Hydatigena taeniaeformis TaxID=6205 RepID=A0A0R3WK18_HYDTA|nr:unnamed protein product [Hydatigera taeniaeformis]
MCSCIKGILMYTLRLFRKQYVYVDIATLIRLQVFDSSICEPVSKIVNFKRSQDGPELTLFDYLNTCSSTLGSRLLSQWLRVPLKDDEELHRRQYAVEFLTRSANRGLHKLLVGCIKRVGNIQRVLTKMHASSAASNEWKMLIQTLQSLKSIMEICRHHPELSVPMDTPDNVPPPWQILHSLLEKIVETIDMSSTSSHKRFIVKQGHHAWLDEWKQIYRCLPDILSRLAEHELNRLRGHVDACGLIYFPLVRFKHIISFGLAYLLTITLWQCLLELDKRYGDVMYAILDAETSIMHELQEEILKAAKPLLCLLDFATELDCICALATAAIRMNGVKPRMVSESRVTIRGGRHILYEALHTNYRTNSFISPTEKGSVTLVTGPNASGKTMFIKQVTNTRRLPTPTEIGLIVYLAHIGSFVPADCATIPLMDAIMALMPADIERQAKTQEFLSDASWLATALRYASANSLLLLDEFPYFSDQVARKSLFLGFLEYMSQRDSSHVIVTGLNMNWAKQLLQPLVPNINLRVCTKMQTPQPVERIDRNGSERVHQ